MVSLVRGPSDRKIAIIDDDQSVVDVISLCLKAEGYEVRSAAKSEEALSIIHDWIPDVVILDINLPQISGLEILRHIRQLRNHTATILLSGNDSTEEVVRGLDAGADDYIVKPFDPYELLARVRAQLRIKDLNDQLMAANDQLKEMVDTDDLTGLFNMRSLYQRLDFEVHRGRRFERTVCVVMMDMDNFKHVNDGHDHLFGSFVISEVGKIIKNVIRNVDIGARYGGDEFLVVLTEIDRFGAYQFCERLRKKVERHLFESGSDRIRLTMSLGFAITDPRGPELESKQLVRIADWALYEAKRLGRNRVYFYDLAQHQELYDPNYQNLKKAQ